MPARAWPAPPRKSTAATLAVSAIVRNVANIATPSAGCSAHPFGQFAVAQARHGYAGGDGAAHEGSKTALAAMLAAAERLPDLLAMRRRAWEAGQDGIRLPVLR